MELVAENTSVKKIAGIKGEPVASDSMDMLNAEKFLTSCFYLNEESYNQYLIFRDNPVVISSGEIMSSLTKQDYDAYGQEGMDFTEFQQLVFENERQLQYLVEKDGDEDGGILGVLKTMSSTRFFCDTAMVFTLNRQILNDIFCLDGEQKNDFAYVTDSYGQVLYRENYEGEMLSKRGYDGEHVNVNGEAYTVFQIEAPESGLIFTMGISDVTIADGVADVNRIITVYIICAVAGMIAFCIMWARSRARNMGNVLQELEMLRGSISESILEKLLLHGVYTAKERAEAARYLNWDMEFFSVVCVSTRLEQENRILETFCRIDEFVRNTFTAVALSVGENERNYIIQLQEEAVLDMHFISEKMKELLEELPEIDIGISEPGTGLENIQLCYRQAKLMNRQAVEQYDCQMKVYQKPTDIREKVFKLNLGNRMYDLINAGEKETIRALFDKIRSYAARTNWYTESEIMQFFFEVQNPIAKSWDEIEQHGREKAVLTYRSDKTISELLDGLEETSYYLCDCICKNRENNKNLFTQKMIQFVEDNYTSKDMCISYVAEHLGISDKYFAALFKEQTGKNFSAYVETRRMKKAEYYLLETDTGMARIAELVGYNTVDAFYKSFKKVYGLAPGKWKESKKKL